MKSVTICVIVILALGCATKPDAEVDFKTWSLRPHLDTESEWGAVQGGIAIRLRETDAGIVLVVRNDSETPFEIDPFFLDGYNVEVEAYDIIT